MKNNKKGQCKLCLMKNVDIRDSHLLPASCFPEGNNKLISIPRGNKDVVNSYKVERNIKKGISEYLLCQNCETMTGDWDNALIQLIRRIKSTRQRHRSKPSYNLFSRGTLIESIMAVLPLSERKFEKLKLGILSVLYRCHIAKHDKAVCNFSLGDNAKEIRQIILQEKTLPLIDYDPIIVCSLYVETEFDGLYPTYECDKLCFFVMGGLGFHVPLGKANIDEKLLNLTPKELTVYGGILNHFRPEDKIFLKLNRRARRLHTF